MFTISMGRHVLLLQVDIHRRAWEWARNQCWRKTECIEELEIRRDNEDCDGLGGRAPDNGFVSLLRNSAIVRAKMANVHSLVWRMHKNENEGRLGDS